MGSHEERPWCMLLPLILEHVGAALERDGVSDLLRARLACKHWRDCLSRCVTRLTLHAGAVALPPAGPPPPPPPAQPRPHHSSHNQNTPPQAHISLPPPPPPPEPAPAPAPPDPRYARHADLIPSLAPSLRHVILRGTVCHLADLPALMQRLPALTTLSLQADSYNPRLTAGLTAEAAGSGDDVGARLHGTGEPPPPPPPPPPPRLERLWLTLQEDLPPDTLRRLLLPPADLAEPPSAGAPAPAVAAAAPPQLRVTPPLLPLREVGLLPRLGGLLWHQRPRPASLDLTPLLDPRLAGVTRLILTAMTRPLPPPPPSAADAHQQQQQQQQGAALGAGQPRGGAEAAAAAAGDLGFEEVVGRMTQLRSLTVLAQVELAALLSACLAPLSRLEALQLPGGVYCDTAADLGRLAALSALTALELNFESEWWMDAGDLCVLSRLKRLRHLKLALDYGLGYDEALSTDESYEQSYDDNGVDAGADGDVLDDEQSPPPPLAPPHAGPADALRGVPSAAAAAAGVRWCRTYDTLEGLSRALAAAVAASAQGPARAALSAGRSDPGVADDWRAPLGCLTQLTKLEMQLGNGGGRQLAEALHAAAWLATAPGGGGADGGALLELRDAPAAAFLDVPYWSRVAAAAAAAVAECRTTVDAAAHPGAAAAGAGGGSAAAAAGAATADVAAPPAGTAAPLLPLAAPLRAAPLVSLQLGSGRVLCLSYAHILCLGLMTDLRSLDISCEVAAMPAEPATVSKMPYETADNPLLVLARLRRLRELRLRLRQPRPPEARPDGDASGGGSGSPGRDGGGHAVGGEQDAAGGGGAPPPPPVTPIDDDVVLSWMHGMPYLQTLALRGAGRLGERALAAVGRHGALASLELRLKVAAPPPAGRQDGSDGRGGSGGGGDAGVQIGYGSYYAVYSAAREGAAGGAGPSGGGGGSLLGSGAATPLGVSPDAPGGGWMAAAAPHLPGAAGAGGGGGGGPAAAAASLGRGGAWLDRLLAAGVRVVPELLADVPYLIRPHHLPPSLTSLDLTNAVFSAEWATRVSDDADVAAAGDAPAADADAPSSSAASALPADAAAAAAAAAAETSPATTPGGVRQSGDSNGTVGGGGAPRPLPRLVTLKLSRRPPRIKRLRERAEAEAARDAAAAAAAADGGSPPSPRPSPPPSRAPLDPTRLTDWLLTRVVARHFPTLAHLELNDAHEAYDSGGEAGGKLHHRAVAQLGRLSYLESLTMHVGNRLRWRAQEALFGSLPAGSLRRLRLHAAHVYREAVAMATRLTRLAALQVIGYTEPDYTPELQAAAAEVRAALPECHVLVWPRDVDVDEEQLLPPAHT